MGLNRSIGSRLMTSLPGAGKIGERSIVALVLILSLWFFVPARGQLEPFLNGTCQPFLGDDTCPCFQCVPDANALTQCQTWVRYGACPSGDQDYCQYADGTIVDGGPPPPTPTPTPLPVNGDECLAWEDIYLTTTDPQQMQEAYDFLVSHGCSVPAGGGGGGDPGDPFNFEQDDDCQWWDWEC